MMQRRNHPMEDAVWLLEYISATKGADHMRLASRHLNFFQYFSLDVIGVLLIVFILFATVSIKLLGILCGCGRSSKKRKSD